ncbi:AraC family transcriptional regulator ligand-binding domain-containing protein [Nannocystis sp. ILAH1]|uniref:AraC family transcriptional regulator n=1 Tax=unclassified Nannocystis TaxID=2627009 RepID=UPI00226E218D|nr:MULTISPECIES: AraC family transcriptional regulator [unclassified Nannocystis]MCY0989914.1 AraC family transcriptional regulator ligand-binding domain-containing protein [Nannocystis sp. ILAH1]MCY1071049.1 AraC family transcriptional regulator ligand-binding domain-containing protein [Nannocystis sp. RBIL2]
MGSHFPARLLAFAESGGLLADELLARSGLGAAALADPDARVPLLGVYALIEAVCERLGDAASLRFVAAFDAGDLDALGFLLQTCPDLGAALERFVAFQALYTDGERFEAVRLGDDSVALRYTPFGPPRRAHAWMAEVTFLDFLVNGPRWLGRALAVKAVRLRRGPTEDAALRRALGPVEFGALCDELVLPRTELALRMPGADAAMHAFFERFARGQLSRLPADASLRARVRLQIIRRLHRGAPTLLELADELGLAPRTLQRKLQAEGETLAGLVDAVRRERAAELLAGPQALSEVSYLLGFSAPSAFFRAFRRWTGETPEGYRARLRGE